MLMAPCDPIDKSTYIYLTEDAYYSQYAQSYYAPTMKKAGWDCLRHYEIMANWCIPYFRCLDQCPPTIMQHLPKRELRLVQECIDSTSLKRLTLEHIYGDLLTKVMDAVFNHLTTESLASYVLSTVGVTRKETVCT